MKYARDFTPLDPSSEESGSKTSIRLGSKLDKKMLDDEEGTGCYSKSHERYMNENLPFAFFILLHDDLFVLSFVSLIKDREFYIR